MLSAVVTDELCPAPREGTLRLPIGASPASFTRSDDRKKRVVDAGAPTVPRFLTVSDAVKDPPGAAAAGGLPTAVSARSGRVTCTADTEATQLFVSSISLTDAGSSAHART